MPQSSKKYVKKGGAKQSKKQYQKQQYKGGASKRLKNKKKYKGGSVLSFLGFASEDKSTVPAVESTVPADKPAGSSMLSMFGIGTTNTEPAEGKGVAARVQEGAAGAMDSVKGAFNQVTTAATDAAKNATDAATDAAANARKTAGLGGGGRKSRSRSRKQSRIRKRRQA
jgi:hypothetical protein